MISPRHSPFHYHGSKELLYKKYKAENFKNDIAVSLADALLDRQERNIYNTFECEIYDQEKLIAVSFFDLGATSISSIMGMYDPDYSDYSLGYYTMLLEIEYGQERGFEYYYPGYVTPGFQDLITS
ncbi:MAG: GNAT family N-acetyltransferase [Saprospiraceae bacterium]|nr:GNAT family N-acetyltransferase [Saprospiraceae bacterium]